MNTDEPSAADAATTSFGLRREAKRHAAFTWARAQLEPVTPKSGVAAALCHRSPKSLPPMRELSSLYYGFRTVLFIHTPGEPLVFCKGLVSVSIRVYPWLNCVFQDQNSNASMNRHDKQTLYAAGIP
jgi:hypothetical protein